MDLVNLTPFAARHAVLLAGTGEETLLVVAKATFDLRGGSAVISEVQEPVRVADEYHGEPDKSSIKWASDAALSKPATDVVLVGGAYSTPANRYQVDVRLRVGRLEKWVRVFGDRRWNSTAGVATAGAPEPFERMPLVWERAFGGIDRSDGDRLEGQPRNPVGVGFRARKSQLPVAGSPIPNLENPWQHMRGPADRPEPAGFSFIGPSWEPRLGYAGTYDPAWQKHRAPLLPDDFNPYFFQAAPADQIYPGALEEGAPIEVDNASPSGRLACWLPAVRVAAVVKAGDDRFELPLRRDTVVIDGDRERLILVWRASMSVHGRVYAVDWIKVHTPDGLHAS